MRAQRSRRATDLFVLSLLTLLGLGLAASANGLPLQLDVVINGVPKQLIAGFVLGEDGKLSATGDELTEIGLNVGQDKASSDALIALDAVSGLVYRYDEQQQRIEIDASMQRLAVQRLDPRADEAKSRAPPRSDIGALLNYGLHTSSQLTFDQDSLFGPAGASASLDGRVFSKFGVLSQSAIVRGTEDFSDVLRLDTTLEHADPKTMMTYRAGDVVSGGLSWTRPIRLGGAQAQRRFGLRPDLVTIPLPSYSGSAAVPSTVDVYVDGLRLYSRDIEAGPFEVSNLPIVTGNGQANVVVRDASGQTSVATLPFFTSGSLLRPGLTDFSVEVGFARRSFGSESNDYDESPIASATLRLGLTDTTTLEAHAEGSAALLNGGAGLVTSAGHIGVISAAIAASTFEDSRGLLASGSFETDFMGVNFSAVLRGTIGDYHDLASVTAPDFSRFDALFEASLYQPARRLASLSAGRALPDDWGYAGLNFTYLENAAREQSAILAASYSIGLARNANLSANIFHDLAGRSGSGLFVRYSVPFGENGYASADASYGDGGALGGLEASKPISERNNLGWWARTDTDRGKPSLSGALSHRSRVARTDVAFRRLGGSPVVEASAQGAISTLGDGIHLSNRIDDSFAVVDVGVPGVEVLHENNVVGVTDRSGRAVVPNLRSYEDNRIAIDPKNLPVDVAIASTGEMIVPSDRAGLKIDMAVKSNANVALISVVDGAGQPISVGATGQLEGGQSFVVGYDGEVYLEGLRDDNRFQITVNGATCSGAFDYAPRPGEQVQIRGVQCL